MFIIAVPFQVHRANQMSAPKFIVLMTNVGGERRFLSSIAKRLRTLGALTRGDREAALGHSTATLSDQSVESIYGRQAARFVISSLGIASEVRGQSWNFIVKYAC